MVPTKGFLEPSTEAVIFKTMGEPITALSLTLSASAEPTLYVHVHILSLPFLYSAQC